MRASSSASVSRSFKGTAVFVIKSDDGTKRYLLDLKEGTGEVTLDAAASRDDETDIMLTMGESTLLKLVKGSLSPQMAFMVRTAT